MIQWTVTIVSLIVGAWFAWPLLRDWLIEDAPPMPNEPVDMRPGYVTLQTSHAAVDAVWKRIYVSTFEGWK